MSAAEITDAEVVDATSTELVTQPPTALFRTDDPVEVIEKATAVANALKDVLDSRGLTQMIQGKSHVRVEGWTTLGAMLGVTAVCVATESVDGGYRATVEARMPDGRVVGRADALCTKYEKRGPWKTSDDYARLSMAQTRATSKALKGPLGFVISLAGYSTTPAEEMTFVEGAAEQVVEQPQPSGDALPLTDSARQKVVDAIKEAGQKLPLVLAAVGVDSTDDLTKGHAMQIRKLLDGES